METTISVWTRSRVPQSAEAVCQPSSWRLPMCLAWLVVLLNPTFGFPRIRDPFVGSQRQAYPVPVLAMDTAKLSSLHISPLGRPGGFNKYTNNFY